MEIEEKRVETLARQLHIWYLEALKDLDPKNYNKKANKDYDLLNEDQKSIDRYISKKLIQEVEKWQKKMKQMN